HLISSADQYSPSPMQSRPIPTCRFSTSATTGSTCAATSSPPTSPRARRRAVSSKPEGTGSRPTWLVRILCALFFIGLLPWSLELFQSAPPPQIQSPLVIRRHRRSGQTLRLSLRRAQSGSELPRPARFAGQLRRKRSPDAALQPRENCRPDRARLCAGERQADDRHRP